MNKWLRICLFHIALITVSFSANAQITVSPGHTAAELAAALTGTGVTVISPTLTCPAIANGTYTTGAIDPIGIPNGIVLASGSVSAVAAPASTFASTPLSPSYSDADLNAMAGGGTTEDACVLEFDFRAAGDTVKFNYVFGSEEYPEFDCTIYNDVFGFLISGGSYATPTNIALVPGTSIPVCINSVNCASPAGASCTGLGTGSPFCAYYVDNGASTLLVYDGITTKLTAIAVVSPCDTYHLKLAIADKGDPAYDSGVFLEGGSLTSSVPTTITAAGTSGLPYCIRGCLPGNFVFTIPSVQDTDVVIHYLITGSAVNGYDYTTIPDSVIIPTSSLSTTLNINTLLVPPVGPKVVTLEIQIPDPCHPGVYTTGAIANLTILDSFSFHIVTPDTAICLGQHVDILAVGDTLFDSLLTYTWTPASTIDSVNVLTPTATPVVTTTYTLTGTADPVLGCPIKTSRITITIFNAVMDTVTKSDPTVCGYCDGSLTLWGLETGYADTVYYTYNGTPHVGIPSTVSSATHSITISGLCAGTYTNIYVKVGICRTAIKGPIIINNPPPPTVTVDSPLVKTCVGIPVTLHAYATPVGPTYNFSWSPATYLSSTTVFNPIVTPMATGDIVYTVTVNPGTNPVCASTAIVTVHTVPNDFTLHNHDTAICIGESVNVDITGSSEFTWVWTPPTGVSNTNIMEPTITPTVDGSYTVTASYAHCPDMVHHFDIEVDHPAPLLTFVDTICLGMSYSAIDVTVPGSTGIGNGYYHYQWTPAGDVSNDTIPNPVITPVVTGAHVYSVVVSPHAASCAVTDLFYLQVYPNSISLLNNDTAICRGASVQIFASGDPIFTYQWLPTAGVGAPFTVAPLITPDTSATYIVRASFHKCPDIVDSVKIDVQPNPVISIAGSTTVCQFDSLHLHVVVTPSWYTHYNYTWTPGTNLDYANTNVTVYTATDTGKHKIYLTVETPAGCKANDSVQLTVYPGNFFTGIKGDQEFCPHESAVLEPLGDGVSFQWHPGLYLSDSNGLKPTITPETNQTYSVVATSKDGCKDTAWYYATVHPSAIFFMPDSVRIYPGETYQIDPQTNCTKFRWTPSGGLSSPYISNPVASPAISTRYIVHATTEWGCSVRDTILVYVDEESVIAVPNAFTPGNGANSEFKIIKRGLASLNYFRIFNRWGNLIFETKDIDEGWNGEYKGVPQPLGVFVYQLEAVTNSGKIISKQGNVTLIR